MGLVKSLLSIYHVLPSLIICRPVNPRFRFTRLIATLGGRRGERSYGVPPPG
jgi:hypothetical protein